MNYATFAALNNYDDVATALAANTTDGDAWLLNESHIFQDGTMGNPAPDASALKNPRQIQRAKTLTPTVTRNKSAINTVGGAYQNSLTDAANKETVPNVKTPSIRHKVTWFVTDSTKAKGYERVHGLLEDPATSDPGRDDDAQVRI